MMLHVYDRYQLGGGTRSC